MSAHILMALQVHADDAGFIDVNAALRRAAVPANVFSRELCRLVRSDIVRSANRVRGVNGVMPDTCFQLAEGFR